MANLLKGKITLITGASGGIGSSISSYYLKEGATVILTDIRKTDREKELIKKSDKASYQTLDVTHKDDWEKAIGDIFHKFGKLNILVNNAGVFPEKLVPIYDVSNKNWQKLLNVDLTGNFFGMKYAMRAIKDKGGSLSIINISSTSGLAAQANLASYNAAKSGTRLLTKSAALDAASNKLNIRVNSVHPGMIDTDMTRPLGKFRDQIEASIPMGEIGKPSDIAHICVYLGSDDSRYATGAEFTVDGGYTDMN